MAENFINQVVIFVPRINLATQFELDWKAVRQLIPWRATMRDINHRPNEEPLILLNSDGYISTYSSLVSSPQMHLRQIQKKSTLIIFDEADRLGADYVLNDFTLSAKWAEEAGRLAKMIFVMSGTPVRADGKPLLFAFPNHYTEEGKLIPDVSSTYRDGVRDGYLRRFDFRLVDGGYTIVKLNERQDMTIKDTENAIGQVLVDDDVWKPMVNIFIERLHQQKQIVDSRICGLIAANGQAHARKIEEYLRETTDFKILIAVSEDGEAAQKNLRQFKNGRHDILITVSMAYIGYDHKPISVLLLLTSFRTEAYLRQLVARGLRVWSEIPLEKQYCLAIAPDDIRMADFVNKLRSESEWGYKQQQERQSKSSRKGSGDYQEELSYIADAFISDMRAMGLDPSGDASPEELHRMQTLLDARGLPYPVSDMLAIVRAFAKPQSSSQTPKPTMTSTERLKDAKSRLKKACGECDYSLSHSYNSAETYKRLYQVYEVGTSEVKSVEEIEDRIFTVLRWKNQGYYDDRK